MCCISGEYDGNDNKATSIKKGKHLITEWGRWKVFFMFSVIWNSQKHRDVPVDECLSTETQMNQWTWNPVKSNVCSCIWNQLKVLLQWNCQRDVNQYSSLDLSACMEVYMLEWVCDCCLCVCMLEGVYLSLKLEQKQGGERKYHSSSQLQVKCWAEFKVLVTVYASLHDLSSKNIFGMFNGYRPSRTLRSCSSAQIWN